MQKNATADKKRLIWDGFEVPGLVSVGDVNLERGQIEAPEFKVTRKISNGVTVIPAVDVTYRLDRDTETRKFIDDWWDKDEVKDGVLISTDASGSEIKRELLPKCEIVKKMVPAYDGQNPTYSQYQITILPWDVINIP